MPRPRTILPDTERLHLLHLAETDHHITAGSRRCARRVHSRYSRYVAGLPWHDVPFRMRPLRLYERRFFCEESTCPQHILTDALVTDFRAGG